VLLFCVKETSRPSTSDSTRCHGTTCRSATTQTDRGHGRIERYVTDLAGNPTSAIAGLRNRAIGATGHTNITETARWANRNMHRPFHIVGLN
jgi:hypothetical protein